AHRPGVPIDASYRTSHLIRLCYALVKTFDLTVESSTAVISDICWSYRPPSRATARQRAGRFRVPFVVSVSALALSATSFRASRPDDGTTQGAGTTGAIIR